MDKIFSVFKEFLPLPLGGLTVSTARLIPRVGPGRAVWIGLRSRFAFKPNPESLRFSEIKLLKRRLADKDIGQGYLGLLGRHDIKYTLAKESLASRPQPRGAQQKFGQHQYDQRIPV